MPTSEEAAALERRIRQQGLSCLGTADAFTILAALRVVAPPPTPSNNASSIGDAYNAYEDAKKALATFDGNK